MSRTITVSLLRSCARAALASLVISLAAAASGPGDPVSAQGGEAVYTVTVTSLAPPRFRVRAELPLADDTLRSASSRPCDLPAICQHGWPVLVSGLTVTGPDGRVLRTDTIGTRGWVLRDARGGRVTVAYDVDYGLLAENHWPAPRETAFSDGATLYSVGRPLFVGTSATQSARITFALPPLTHVSAPWTRDPHSAVAFTAAGFDALVDNGFVIGRVTPAPIVAGRFELDLGLFGRWAQQRELVTRLLSAHLATFTRLLGFDEPGGYLAVFLDDPDQGGESFLASYALSASPDSAVAGWGRLIAHEVFHYWNGQRIRGADYVSSQWFQEGATEYYAILSMARNGFITPAVALEQLSRHLQAHRQYGKSLAASGSRKDRGFYGSATMVAFVLDLTIRDATGNRRSLDDLMRRLWLTHGRTGRPYTQAELVGLAGEIAGRDLAPFFRSHVEGDVPLPMDSVLPLAGLKVTAGEAGADTITEDPLAPEARRNVWRAIVARDSAQHGEPAGTASHQDE